MKPQKPSETAYPIHDLISRRWSPRAYSDKPVDMATIGSLLEAARWAASSNNEQPWRFMVATKAQPTEFAVLLDCLKESNQVWAMQAPVLLLSVAKRTFDDGSANRHALHDVGQAAANLAIQATAHDLVVHQMAGFSVEKARVSFKIPEDFEPVAVLAIGYQGDAEQLPDRLREREVAPRSREALETMVFSGRWGQPAVLTK